MEALKLNWTQMTKLIFHVADAPPHGREYHRGYDDNLPQFDHSTPGGIPSSIRMMVERNIDYHFSRVVARPEDVKHLDCMVKKFNSDAEKVGRHDFVQTADLDRPGEIAPVHEYDARHVLTRSPTCLSRCSH